MLFLRYFLLWLVLVMVIVMVVESEQHAADQYLPASDLELRP